MGKIFFILASFFGFLSVLLGAFAAHFLKQKLSSQMFDIFEVAVRYQVYHTFALFIVAIFSKIFPDIDFQFAGWSFVFGIIIFSGSLYLLSLTETKFFGAITPIGGVCFLIGWGILFWKFFSK